MRFSRIRVYLMSQLFLKMLHLNLKRVKVLVFALIFPLEYQIFE